MPIVTTAAVDNAVASARSLPDLVNKVAIIDPSLADALSSKALIASKTPWGTLAGGAITWAAARYGLNWDPGFCALVGGAGVLVASYAMRTISSSRIGGVFSARPARTASATVLQS